MRVIALTNKGNKEVNEDCYIVNSKFFYNENVTSEELVNAFVFDGVSTSVNAREASSFAAKEISSLLPLFTNEESVRKYLTEVNRSLTTTLNGSYSTIAGVVINDNNLLVINLGDSKVYRLREGILRKLSIDDTYYEYLKTIHDDNYKNYEDSHMITACLGMNNFESSAIHIKNYEYGIIKGDYFLICSDGVSDLVNEEEIIKVLEEKIDLDMKKLEIERLVKSRGSRDNYTFILVEV